MTKSPQFDLIRNKKYIEILEDAMIGTWFNYSKVIIVTWTLSIELWASYFVFFLTETVIHYRNRWTIYLSVLIFLYIPSITERYGWTNYGLKFNKNDFTLIQGLVNYLPLFIYGVILSDLENSSDAERPLDFIREQGGWIKIVINISLIIIFMFYGSLLNEDHCKNKN